MSRQTTISLKFETKDELVKFAKPRESWDSTIKRLLRELEEARSRE